MSKNILPHKLKKDFIKKVVDAYNTERKKNNITLTINQNILNIFKKCCDADARKYSQVVEMYMNRYIETKR